MSKNLHFVVSVLLLLVTLLSSTKTISQTSFTATYTFPSTGADGNVASFNYNGAAITGLNMGPIVKTGVTTSSSSNNFRASEWSQSGFDSGKYIGFSMQAVAGYEFTVTSITFGVGRSGTGTRNSEWRGSHNSYASTINNYTTVNSGLTNNSGVLNNPDTNSSWTGNVLNVSSLYSDVTSAAFRLFLYDAETSTGTAGLQGSITISGTFRLLSPSCTAPAVPSGTISGTTPACNNTTLSFSGTAPSDVTNYWQTTPTGTSEANNAATPLNVTTSGTYYVRAKRNSEDCWSDATTAYNVVINTTPIINTQPTNQFVTTGSQATFSVSSANATSFQWQVNTGSGWNNVSNGSGGTTANYTTIATTLAMNGNQYRVVLGNSCDNNVISNAVTLNVSEAQVFQKITSLASLTDGYYIVAFGESFAMNNTHNGTFLDRTAISPINNEIINSNPSIVWKIETNGGGRTIFNEQISKFISYTGSSNNVQIVDGVTTNNQRWNITYESDLFVFANLEVTNRILQYNNVVGSERFACYTTNQQKFTLYKLAEPATPEPQIAVSQGASNIPSGSGNYNFGNQLVNSSSSAVSFTISNDGDADLTLGTIALSGANANQFSINIASTSATVSPSGSTTFAISFLPTSLGSKSATITIPNNAGPDFTFTISGNGTNSALSNMIETSGFVYTNNIAYTTFQSTTISNTGSGANGSLGVFQFNVQDGGGSADADELPTTLNALSFTYTGQSNTIRAAALFQANGKLADATVTANGISFTGLTIQAPDNGNSPSITLRVTFNNTVLDNQQLQFTVSSATANVSGSVFASANAGGATSSTTGDRNRIEVTADRLAFTTQPQNQTVGLNLSSFTVSAVDAFSNVDLDYTTPNAIALTTSGVNMTSAPPYVFNNGQINISDVSFSTAQSNINVVATGVGLAFSNTTTSNNFNISAITILSGTYRTTSNGTWPNNASGNATWERFNGSVWQSSGAPGANATDVLIIRHNITTNAAFAASSGGTKMTIANGGTFNGGHNCTFSELIVEENGIINITSPAVTMQLNSGLLTVESGGKVIINSSTLNNADGIWRGTENFKDGSILEIQNWDWDNSGGGANRLLSNPPQVSPNENGYYFGNIIFNANPSENFTFVSGIPFPQPSLLKLANNNLEINNLSTTNNTIQLISTIQNIEIGGSIIVNQGLFRFSSVTTAATTHNINGNLILNGGQLNLSNGTTNANFVCSVFGNLIINSGTLNLGQVSSGTSTSNLLLYGNLDIKSAGIITSTDEGCNLRFAKSGEQTASFGGIIGANIDFEILSGSITKLINNELDFDWASNKLTILDGGALDFNYRDFTGIGIFEQQSGGILKITSADGVNVSGNNTGNIQNTGTRTYNTTGHFHYVGNVSPQATGNAMTAANNQKRIVIDKDNATDIVNLSQSVGTTNQLYIKKGILNESVAAFVTGSGSLQMDLGSAYRMYVLDLEFLPQLSGTYTINDGASIELLGAGNQVLRGGRAYYDLVFGNGGVKTISNAISTIGGGVLIDDNTTLDVQSSTFGGGSTALFMGANSRFINGGASTKPNIGGDYLLDETSTIEFVGTAATIIRASGKTYANVDVAGSNVTLSTNTTSLDFLPNATFRVKNGGVFDVKNNNGLSGANNTAIRNTNNPTVVLETGSTIEYIHTEAQTVTNEVPYSTLVLKGNGLKTFVDNTEVNANLLVSETASALVPATKTLTVLGDIIKSNTEDFTIANNAFLMQSDAQTVNNNSGNLKVQRATSLIRRGDVTIWSAPVANQNLLAFSPETLTNRFFIHNEATNTFENITPSSNVFQAGRGYGIRARNTLLSTDPMENWLGTFAGVPNNGSYSFSIFKTPNSPQPGVYDPTGYNMVGNPYPSALNLLDFYNENSAIIENKFYLYEHTLPSNIPSGNPAYTNYGVLTVGIPSIYAPATQSDTSNPADINPYEPTIQPGQGFFVRATDNGNLNFLNSMRNNVSGNFFRSNNVASNGLDMFRLKLTAPNNFSNQTVIGFFETTSNEWDATDTRGFSNAPLYSILANDKLVIQARSYPLEQSTVIPIGFHAGVSGTHTLALHQPEGIFVDNQYVLLHDLMLGVYHNLSIAPYQFEIPMGAHDNRFQVLFSEVLSNDNPDFEAHQLIAFSQENEIHIQLKGNSLMQKIKLYDLSGRLIYEANDVQNSQVKISNITPTNTVLMVQVVNEEGKVLITKLIY
ncbi:MAG: choice-of-anchor D domain-containing protein [Flavobacterium sp.]